MNITILYDNESLTDGTQADWGFSCLIEHDGVKLLFDTGASGAILIENMRVLGVDPESIEEVFISHSHFDHSGGLSSFLDRNNRVKVYAPNELRGIKSAREVVYVDESFQLRDGFYSTGMLKGIEQSLAIRTEKGLVVVVGCAHPGVEAILNAVKPFGTAYALIGGLHGFAEYDILEPLSRVCPTHCTRHINEIRSLYPNKFISGGVGAEIDL
ncbi:MAG TPA: MBL fold metallo-hydrolase [candidate division Zixibacteria bacterium]|nr:MBL fold metallo-hydrolase [candidate division Zixibacteria bacterium]